MSARKSLQCILNYFSPVGLTASVEASFVLRRQGSIDLPGPKCGKVKKGKPDLFIGRSTRSVKSCDGGFKDWGKRV